VACQFPLSAISGNTIIAKKSQHWFPAGNLGKLSAMKVNSWRSLDMDDSHILA
jgi:hypothetical protein